MLTLRYWAIVGRLSAPNKRLVELVYADQQESWPLPLVRRLTY